MIQANAIQTPGQLIPISHDCQETRDLTLQTTEIDSLLVKEKTTVLLRHGFK